MNVRSRLPYGALMSYTGLVVASWMPWGKVPTADQMSTSLRSLLPFPVHEGSMTITAWNVDITLAGVLIPNWGPLVAGSFLAALLVLRTLELWQAPLVVAIALVTYGLVHLCYLSAMILDYGDIGAGSVLSCGCFLLLSIIMLRAMVSDLRRQLAEAKASTVAVPSRRAPYTR